MPVTTVPVCITPDQTNSDGDAYGNACDNCPNATNPGPGGCR